MVTVRDITHDKTQRKVQVTHRNDSEAIQEALGRVEHASNREAARLLGVSDSTVRRWRAGNTGGLREPAKSAVYRALQADELPPEEPPEFAPAPDEMTQVCADLARLGEPGERTARKLTAIDHRIAYLTNVDRAVPAWLYEVRERVERGDL